MTGDSQPVVVITCPCEQCGRDTGHAVLHAVEDNLEISKVRWAAVIETIRCMGCRTVSLRQTMFLLDEHDRVSSEPRITFVPDRLTRRVPRWVDQLDQDLHDLLDEIYSALRGKNYRLVAMGARTVIDAVVRDKVGDQGTFDAHLDALEREGIIGKKQRETLEIVIEAGSAAIHRQYKPPIGLVDGMLDAVETVLNQVYINGPMLASAKQLIPPRPPLTSGSKSNNGPD